MANLTDFWLVRGCAQVPIYDKFGDICSDGVKCPTDRYFFWSSGMDDYIRALMASAQAGNWSGFGRYAQDAQLAWMQQNETYFGNVISKLIIDNFPQAVYPPPSNVGTATKPPSKVPFVAGGIGLCVVLAVIAGVIIVARRERKYESPAVAAHIVAPIIEGVVKNGLDEWKKMSVDERNSFLEELGNNKKAYAISIAVSGIAGPPALASLKNSKVRSAISKMDVSRLEKMSKDTVDTVKQQMKSPDSDDAVMAFLISHPEPTDDEWDMLSKKYHMDYDHLGHIYSKIHRHSRLSSPSVSFGAVDVQVKIDGGKLYVKTPYDTGFIHKSRQLGGKWESPYWVFDVREEPEIKKYCLGHFGSFGSEIADRTDITITVGDKDWNSDYTEPLKFRGFIFATARGRDTGARPESGVVAKSGGFTSGGSRSNWTTIANAKSVIDVRGFPKNMVEPLKKKLEGIATVVEISPTPSPPPPSHPKDPDEIEKLKNERDSLLKRLEEIDNILRKDEPLVAFGTEPDWDKVPTREELMKQREASIDDMWKRMWGLDRKDFLEEAHIPDMARRAKLRFKELKDDLSPEEWSRFKDEMMGWWAWKFEAPIRPKGRTSFSVGEVGESSKSSFDLTPPLVPKTSTMGIGTNRPDSNYSAAVEIISSETFTQVDSQAGKRGEDKFYTVTTWESALFDKDVYDTFRRTGQTIGTIRWGARRHDDKIEQDILNINDILVPLEDYLKKHKMVTDNGERFPIPGSLGGVMVYNADSPKFIKNREEHRRKYDTDQYARIVTYDPFTDKLQCKSGLGPRIMDDFMDNLRTNIGGKPSKKPTPVPAPPMPTEADLSEPLVAFGVM